MKLIGLCGRAGSGKDTAFGFAQQWATERGLLAVRRAFADKLKVSAMTALGFVGTEDDLIMLANELKTLGEITTTIPSQMVQYVIDGRKFLQLYGTESHRDVFGSDFWVDALLPLDIDGEQDAFHKNFMAEVEVPVVAFTPPYKAFTFCDFAFVTDVRFENEAQRIHDLGGEIWEVHRHGVKQDETHVSEAGVPVNLIHKTIYNGSSLEAFRHEVEYALNALETT